MRRGFWLDNWIVYKFLFDNLPERQKSDRKWIEYKPVQNPITQSKTRIIESKVIYNGYLTE